MLGPIKSLLDRKEILRLKLAGERKAAARLRPDAARHSARLFYDAIELAANAKVALYHPIKDELDTKPLAEEMLNRKYEIGLPVVEKNNAPLVFRKFERGGDLVKGAFGVFEPKPEAPAFNPDVIVVPLLGFDRRGGRIGYGGGFYDRTLGELRNKRTIIAVGYAYGAQEVDAVPLSRLDQPLDWIITEREAIRVS